MFNYDKDINIGNQTAENDWKLLEKHFIPIDISERIGRLEPSIILGRKGAGKSAMRMHFERTSSEKQRAFSIQPSSDDLYGTFSYVVDNETSSMSVEFIARLWEITLLINVAKSICTQKPEPRQIDLLKELPSDLTSSILSGDGFGLGRTLSVIKLHYGSEEARGNLARTIKNFIKHEIRDSDITYYAMIDSIDEVLHNEIDTTRRRDLFSTFFEGLLSFFRTFVNRERNVIAEKVILYLFIPVDVYNWSLNRHADQIRQYKHQVTWLPRQLDEFISTRLARNLGPAQERKILSDCQIAKSTRKIWESFFPAALPFEAYSGTGVTRFQNPIRDVVIEMTLRRPRDLQEIVRLISDCTRSGRLSFPSEETIFLALERYSVELRTSVETEYSLPLPQLPDILSSFAGNDPEMPRDVLVELVGRIIGHEEQAIYRALNIMFEACIIGAVVDKRSGQEPIVFCYDSYEFRTVWLSRKFVVHRAFWHSLQLVSLRSGRGRV